MTWLQAWRRAGWRHRTAVTAGVTAMLVLGTLDLVQHYDTPPPAAWALSAVRALPLLLYRRWPTQSWWLALTAAVATALATTPVSPAEPWPWPVGTVALLVAMTTILSAYTTRRHTLIALTALTALGTLLALTRSLPNDWWVSVLTTTALCAVGALLGDLTRGQLRVAAALAQEQQTSATERARRAVVEERTRIARELHDVVAHHMSMITVQAETARYRLPDLPKPAIQEFTDIAHLARGSLTELRGLLSALRDTADGPVFAPQPTLADLNALAARITAAGTPVRLRVTSDTTALPNVVQLAAYRVVQESLSNVVRHAPGTPTTVTVTITDTTSTAGPTATTGTVDPAVDPTADPTRPTDTANSAGTASTTGAASTTSTGTAATADSARTTGATGTDNSADTTGTVDPAGSVDPAGTTSTADPAGTATADPAGTTATSSTARTAGTVVVEVLNTRPTRTPEGPSGGHGLVGLRERVTLLGGTLEIDQPNGGWRVRATLPVQELP